ncbi:MAG: ATP-binding cassette domain-containing protein, partial [Stackebrandtia sp.]
MNLTIPSSEKVGVIGENGSGKSTLLRIIAGRETHDNGEVTVHAAGGIGYVGQTLGLPGEYTVAGAVDVAMAPLRDLERRLRDTEASLETATPSELERYGDLLSEFESRGGYEADANVESAMHALGLRHITGERSLASLSGGEQSRLGLACALAASPELLLLDEPTNHLDADGVSWLERRLRDHHGTVVTVTHDRAFLNAVTPTIIEVDADRRGLTRYGDGWQGYRRAKAAARHRWEQEYRDWCDEIVRQTEAAAAGAKVLAAKTTSDTRPRTAGHRRSHETGLSAKVREAKERLRRLETNPVPRPPEPLRFTVRIDGGKGEGLAAELVDVRVGARLFVDKFRIAPGERV